MFYLNWIDPLKSTKISSALKKGYWKTLSQIPKWFSWSGYAFEAICYKHLNQIREALNLPQTAIPNAWRYSPTKSEKDEGAQIDLLFDRDDDSITICEIKFSKSAFYIDKDYAKKLEKKVAVFKKITGTRKQLFIAMISANGVKKNKYSEALISGVITLDDLFQEA